MENETVKTVFLLGAIGAGKSTALEMFQSRGATVLSADAVVHDLYQNDKYLIEQIRNDFGSVVAENGRIDRTLLSQHLVTHPEDIQKLEEVVHPRVRERLSKAIDNSIGDVFVYELPISRPTTDFTLADVIVVIDAPDDARLERVMSRGMSREDAVLRISMHPKPFVPEHKPVFVINNNGNKADLETEVNKVWKAMLRD